MAPDQHAWGESHVKDRIWAQVSGLCPEQVAHRRLMVLQAFIDESEKDDVLVLAGYIASAEQWAKFAEQWAPLARRFGRVAADGRYYFHMSEQQSDPNLLEYLPAFYEVISDNVLCCVGGFLGVQHWRGALDRLLVLDEHLNPLPVSGHYFQNRYLFLFDIFMYAFHSSSEAWDYLDISRVGGKVDFIFDERAEKGKILAGWDKFIANTLTPERFGRTPRFEDDKDFLPLQAADFIAWWIRNKARDGTPMFPIYTFPWQETRNIPGSFMLINEEMILDGMIKQIRNDPSLPAKARVYDRYKLITVAR